jgi:tRNA A-37 threonylcarbamoyl transferase component Bud32/Tol biopolymer transport system component
MTEQINRLKAALAGRYEIESQIGEGGMATVYLAHDVKHERQVALKVLRPDLAAALGPERFTREIRIAAQLQHPHVLPLHDSGEADGFLYYVMPYVNGESLRDRLTRSGELPIDDAVRIIREIVDALAHAHEHGVVHRDLKPDNVMLSKRHALVMDFGVAKAVSEATGRQQLTTAGVALGTPAYMAPEQATADPQTDHRADIYAVGAVAYELLTGSPPFSGPNAQAILAAHVMQEPAQVTAQRESVPAPLAGLVMRCLAKKPADRWQSAEDMLVVLEGLTTTSGGITPAHTRPVAAVRGRNRNAALIAAAIVGAGVVAAAGFLLRGSDGASDAPAPIDRQVTFRGDVEAVALARDGRTIVYKAEEGRSLIVQDLAGGGSNTLVRLDDPALTMTSLHWGPDDSRVFFNLFSDTSDIIASVPRLGGPLRTEVDLQPLGGGSFSGFGASGEYLVTCYSRTGDAWVYLGKAPETLRWASEDSLAGDGTLLNAAAAGMVWLLRPSPDGRWIAYSSVGKGDRLVAGLLSTDGTRHAILAEGLSDLLPIPLGWSRASDAVYYPGFSTLRMEIVKLPVDPERGTRSGEPVVVARGLETGWEQALLADTTLLYAGGAYSSNLKAIDLTGAPQAAAHPTVMLTRGTASNSLAGLSPDGEVVVFQRWTGTGVTAGADAADIYTQPTGGGVERLVARRSGGSAEPLEMSRDGRRVAYYEWGSSERTLLVVVDVATGRTTELPLGGGVTLGWSPDGQRLATVGWGTVGRVVLVDLRDSSEVVVELQCGTDCPLGVERPVFSPDGYRIALIDASHGLWIAALADGHATRITEEADRMLSWTESWLYYVREETGASDRRYPVVYRIAPQGGTPQLYARLPEDCDSDDVTLSLDASTAVCAVIDSKPDVHIVENFDAQSR